MLDTPVFELFGKVALLEVLNDAVAVLQKEGKKDNHFRRNFLGTNCQNICNDVSLIWILKKSFHDSVVKTLTDFGILRKYILNKGLWLFNSGLAALAVFSGFKKTHSVGAVKENMINFEEILLDRVDEDSSMIFHEHVFKAGDLPQLKVCSLWHESLFVV